jgi:hypothetical protein
MKTKCDNCIEQYCECFDLKKVDKKALKKSIQEKSKAQIVYKDA